MPVVTTIKLTGDNHKDVDMVCATIKAISDKSGVAQASSWTNTSTY